MIIDLKTIVHGPREYEFVLEPDWWRHEEGDAQIRGLAGPLAVHMSIYRAGDKFVLDGRVNGRLRVVCDRCVEEYEHEVRSEFQMYLAVPRPDMSVSEIELSEQDMLYDFISGDEVDLAEIVREQVFLSLPMKFLCSDVCMGLCPSCGINLNRGRCGCRRRSGHPGLSGLRTMKIDV